MTVSIKNRLTNWLGVIFLLVMLVLIILRVVREGIYSQNTGINLLVVGEKETGVLILRPNEDLVSWVKLPTNLKVKIYNSQAQYPVGSLWAYGEQEKQVYKITEGSVGLGMGAVLARAVKLNGEVSLESLLTALYKINLKTDLSWRDRFLIRQFLADSLVAKKVLELELPRNAFDLITEPDGKEFVVFNSMATLWAKNKFVLEPLLNENVEVSINNLTGQLGFGIALSRQLEAAGLRVVEVVSDETKVSPVKKNCVFVSFRENGQTEKFLNDQLGCKEVRSNEVIGYKQIQIWLNN